MKEKFYGRLKQVECNDVIDLYVEEIKHDGFALLEGVISEAELVQYREKIDAIYMQQADAFGTERLESIPRSTCVGCR